MKTITVTALATFVFTTGVATHVNATSYSGADIEVRGNNYSNISGIDKPDKNDWASSDDGSIWTAWDRKWVEYTVHLESGNYNIGLNATNIHGKLGDDWYKNFQVLNSANNQPITIAASNDEINFGFINQTVEAGQYTIRYTWNNDKWKPSEGRDANLRITSAFFDNTDTPAPAPEPASILLFGTGLVGLAGMIRKKKK